jgi:hypothetical protein
MAGDEARETRATPRHGEKDNGPYVLFALVHFSRMQSIEGDTRPSMVMQDQSRAAIAGSCMRPSLRSPATSFGSAAPIPRRIHCK